MTGNPPVPTGPPPAPQLRITVTAEVPEEPGQEYTAVEMLLALTNGLRLRGVTPVRSTSRSPLLAGRAPTRPCCTESSPPNATGGLLCHVRHTCTPSGTPIVGRKCLVIAQEPTARDPAMTRSTAENSSLGRRRSAAGRAGGLLRTLTKDHHAIPSGRVSLDPRHLRGRRLRRWAGPVKPGVLPLTRKIGTVATSSDPESQK